MALSREEAEEILEGIERVDSGMVGGYESNSVYALIEKIYDDFESRTCSNCKYGLQFDYVTDYGMCEKSYGWYWQGRMEITKDFGCNKFVRKSK